MAMSVDFQFRRRFFAANVSGASDSYQDDHSLLGESSQDQNKVKKAFQPSVHPAFKCMRKRIFGVVWSLFSRSNHRKIVNFLIFKK